MLLTQPYSDYSISKLTRSLTSVFRADLVPNSMPSDCDFCSPFPGCTQLHSPVLRQESRLLALGQLLPCLAIWYYFAEDVFISAISGYLAEFDEEQALMVPILQLCLVTLRECFSGSRQSFFCDQLLWWLIDEGWCLISVIIQGLFLIYSYVSFC